MSRYSLLDAGRHRRGGGSRLPDRIALIGLLATVVTVAAFASSAVSDPVAANVPPGNKGTAKITVDGRDMDGMPDNDPHPGCIFDLKFFFFPRASNATYTFAMHPPTKGGSTGGDVTLDPSSTPNANVVVDLSTFLKSSGVSPQPQQGFHIKLTVHTHDTRGADVKHKVFWVKCAAAAPSPSVSSTVTASPSPSVSSTATPSGSPSVSPTVTVSLPPPVSSSPSASVAAVTTAKPSTRVKGVTLGRTGSERHDGIVLGALAFIVAGSLIVAWSRKRRGAGL